MLVRRMTEVDVNAVWQIEKESFSMPWSKDGFMDAYKLPDNILLVAEDNEEIVGYACTYVTFDEGELTNIAVASDKRGKGIANQILKTLESEARMQGVSRIVLEVRVSNESARKLYKKHNFEELGIRKNFYEQPVEDAMIMSCTLEEI